MARPELDGGDRRGDSPIATERQPNRVVAAIAARWAALVTWFNSRQLSENAILLGFAVAIGLLTALGVIAFYRAIDLSYVVFYRWVRGTLPLWAAAAYRPILTGAGLALAWHVMQRLGDGHEGMNVPDVQLAVVRRGGNVPGKPALARTLASAITIGSGGSAGSEGPVVVLGAAIGSWLGRAFRFTPDRVTVFVGCASAAAISAAFNAPLAGAFFALEEILGSLSVASFSPVVVSSVIAAVVSRAAFGNHPAFPIPQQYGYGSIGEVMLFFPLLGLLTAFVSIVFVRGYFATDTALQWARGRVPASVVPWLAGGAVGLLVWLSGGQLTGFGHLALHAETFGQLAWYALFALALGKIVVTAITLNGGGSGGVFTPSLYVGAATGGGFGALIARVFPGLHASPEAYALVGMGALIAGATDAPVTGLLLVFEMTDDYAIVLPLMLTVVVAHTIARRFEPDSLYSGWLRRRGESISHGADRDALAGVRVRDVYESAPRVIDEDAPMSVLLGHLSHGEQPCFPVIDSNGHLTGVITVADLGRLAADAGDAGSLIRAADVAQPSEVIALSDSLLDAVRQMGVRGVAALPVVERKTQRLEGLITRGHVMTAYERRVASSSSPGNSGGDGRRGAPGTRATEPKASSTD